MINKHVLLEVLQKPRGGPWIETKLAPPTFCKILDLPLRLCYNLMVNPHNYFEKIKIEVNVTVLHTRVLYRGRVSWNVLYLELFLII